METRQRIDRGLQPGPRIFNSGPYFGTARPDWNQNATTEDIYREVDHWAELGARGFKAKGISPEHLKPLIDRAHFHGLPVAAHLESGFRNSTNAADAVRMGIDRGTHPGRRVLARDRTAYPSWIHVDTASREFKDIIRLFIRNRVAFDPTITAPVYFSTVDDKPGFDFWVDESQFFTPEVQAWVKRQPPRKPYPLFDSLYLAMLRTTRAFHDAGGIVTMGTDNPSRGQYLAGFSSHRELHSLTIAGIAPAAVLRIGTINGAHSLGAGDLLGSIERGKLADLFIIRGNPLTDIRNTRNVRLVIKGGAVYESAALLDQAGGKIGFTAPRTSSPRCGRTAGLPITVKREKADVPPTSALSLVPSQCHLLHNACIHQPRDGSHRGLRGVETQKKIRVGKGDKEIRGTMPVGIRPTSRLIESAILTKTHRRHEIHERSGVRIAHRIAHHCRIVGGEQAIRIE